MSIFSYVHLPLFVYMRGPLLSTTWIPAPIRGLHTITPELRRGLGISTCLPARTQTTSYPKHRFTTTERDGGLGKGHRNGTELGHLCISRGLAPTLSFFLLIALRLLVNILLTSESGSGHYSDCLLTNRRKPTLLIRLSNHTQ